MNEYKKKSDLTTALRELVVQEEHWDTNPNIQDRITVKNAEGAFLFAHLLSGRYMLSNLQAYLWILSKTLGVVAIIILQLSKVIQMILSSVST